jgi:hypothetical protein
MIMKMLDYSSIFSYLPDNNSEGEILLHPHYNSNLGAEQFLFNKFLRGPAK